MNGQRVVSGVVSQATQLTIQNLAEQRRTTVSSVVRELIEKSLSDEKEK